MKKIFAPNGDYVTIPNGRIITFGLNEEQNALVQNALPAKNYELLITETSTDLVAIYATILIINANKLGEEDLDLLFSFYGDLGGNIEETVFWIGNPTPPHFIKTKFKCIGDFNIIATNLKYLFLQSHRKSKKVKLLSNQLMDCLSIIKLIRLYPYIRTQEIVDKLGLSTRTVQRYIANLQAAGEWIHYDYTKKGWYLPDGKTPLFDNF